MILNIQKDQYHSKIWDNSPYQVSNARKKIGEGVIQNVSTHRPRMIGITMDLIEPLFNVTIDSLAKAENQHFKDILTK